MARIHGCGIGGLSGQTADDEAGRFGRNLPQRAHGGFPCLADAPLRHGKLCVQAFIGGAGLLGGFGLGLRHGGADACLRLGRGTPPGFGDLGHGSISLRLCGARTVQVNRDPAGPALQHFRHLRQGIARQYVVEQAEDDRHPDDLRDSQRVGEVELRHLPASWMIGSGVGQGWPAPRDRPAPAVLLR